MRAHETPLYVHLQLVSAIQHCVCSPLLPQLLGILMVSSGDMWLLLSEVEQTLSDVSEWSGKWPTIKLNETSVSR